MSSGALFTSTASVCHRAATSKGATPRMCAGLPGAGGARRSLLCPSLAVALGGKGCKTHAVKSGTSTRMTPLRVRCMANPRRVAKVQQQMRREISSMLQMDKNIRSMLSPEERMGVDNVISVMVTVADVEVSNDLQVVKVFVSILGDDRGKRNAISGLKRLEGYVRRNIGKKVSLRLTPEIRFIYDDSFERGQRVSNLLDELREEREGRMASGGRYTEAELLAVEDTITNPWDDDEDDDWMEGLLEEEEDEGEEDGAGDDEEDDDVDVEKVWDDMHKSGDDDLINVQ